MRENKTERHKGGEKWSETDKHTMEVQGGASQEAKKCHTDMDRGKNERTQSYKKITCSKTVSLN